MSPTRFCAAGESLYGSRWHSSLAEALSVDRRTIRRWGNGEWAVPEGAAEDIRRLLAERLKAIQKLVA